MEVQKVASHNLGIIALDGDGNERNFLMIPRFTPLPFEKKDIFKTLTDNQTSILLRIMEGGIMGENDTCDPLDCNMIAQGSIRDIPPSPKGSPIEVAYKYNDIGILEVHGIHLPSGKEVVITVEHTGGLTAQEIKAATMNIEKASITS